MTLWTEGDSRDLDAEVKALRQADKRERSGVQAPPRTTRPLTDEGFQRRRKVSRAMQIRTEREHNKDERSATYRANRAKRSGRVRWPTPKQKANGRWRAVVTEQGQYFTKTFDTRAEAQAWLDSITGRTDD